jgi:putative chitinase
MEVWGINNTKRRRHFLAQVAHESGGLVHVREIWGPTKAQRRYEGRRDLGNIYPGDGRKYPGRGPIQLTGRANARNFTKAIRAVIPTAPDFEVNPELLELPGWGALAAGWFWNSHGLNFIADRGDVKACSRVVNGGYNGLEDRKRYFEKLSKVID